MPIELNARIGGAESFTNILSAWGVDLAQAAVCVAFGLTPKLPDILVTAAGDGQRGLGTKHASGPCSASNHPLTSARIHDGDIQCPVEFEGNKSCCIGPPKVSSSASSSPRDPPAHHASSYTVSDSFSDLAGRCACGCPVTCCSGGRCCYWDFLLSRNPTAISSDVARRPLSLGGLSEPGPVARSPLSLSGQIPDHAIQALSGRGACMCAELAMSQIIDNVDMTTQLKLSCCSAVDLPVQETSHQDPGSVIRMHVPSESVRNRASIHDLQPINFVHSVNFLPDSWSGWGVIKKLELGISARDKSGYVDSELYGKPGDLVALPPAGFAAMGWIVSKSGANSEDAEFAMADILKYLVVEIDSIP